jgi:hypothetical protein
MPNPQERSTISHKEENMPDLPKISYPISFKDLIERWVVHIQWELYKPLQKNEKMGGSSHLVERYDDDLSLREACAENLLASTLWIESGRQSSEIAQSSSPEIRQLLVYTSNTFVEFLEQKSNTQPGDIYCRESLSVIWTHLFVEFRQALGPTTDPWW